MKKLTGARVAGITLLLLTVVAALFFLFFYKSDSSTADNNKEAPTPIIGYSIINTFPHDTSSFTQGLVVYKGNLYEGTGREGFSKLMKVNLPTGKIEKSIALAKEFFGEGITILHDTIYQLTWQNKKVLVYTLTDFKKIKEFPIATEGWGITTDGQQLIVTDGTSNLYYYDPSTFKLLKQQTVTEAGSLAYNLNEIEYINGFVYANQWEMPYILKINPADGKIAGKIDLNEVWARVKLKDPHANVPNGIAYDADTKKIYITGKLWPELYEIQLAQ